MKKLLFILLAMVLTGCGATAKVQVPELEITAEFVYGKDFGDSTYVDLAKESEYYFNILIKSNQDLSDMNFYSLSTEDGEYFTETENGNHIEKLPKGENLIVYADLGEYIPVMGFSFIDENGMIHHKTVTVSGKDGSAVLSDIKVAE